MFLFLIIIVILFFLACLKNPILGVGLFFSARILIPESARITDSISLNTLLISIMVLFMIKDIIASRKIIIQNFSLLKYYLIFSAVALICLVFSNFDDFPFQLKALIQFFITNMLPGVIAAYYLQKNKDVQLVINILTFSTFICCIWGIIVFIFNANPYIDFFKANSLSTTSPSETISRGFDSSTSGTFIHENGFGYFLPITFAFYFYIRSIKKSKLYDALLILISICILLSTKRSALVALFAFFAAFIFLMPNHKKRIKIILAFIGILLISLIAIEFIPSLGKARGIIESSFFFWDDKVADKYGIGGSSFAMRIMQWIYPFIEVKDNLLFGKGFGWTTLYLSENPFHPILYGFETIIAEAVVTMGICGLFVWSWLFFKCYKYSCKNDNEKVFYKLFTITQLTIAIATGFSYFVFFSLYIVLLNKIYLLKNNYDDKNLDSNGNVQLLPNT